MYKILVTFQMKPGTLDATLAAGRQCLEESRKEPGCLAYDFYRATDGSESFVAVETFVDEAAHDAPEQTAHFKAFFPMLKGNWESVKLETVTLRS
jgi:quinol monooxygenase YgiN